jgi:hypothetical protein
MTAPGGREIAPVALGVLVRRARGGNGLGQAEVGDLGRPVGREEHVGRLQIPVQDTLLMGVMHGAGQRFHHGRGPVGRPGAGGEVLLQRSRFDVLQGEIGNGIAARRAGPGGRPFAGAVDGHDVGVAQAGDRLGFAAKAGQLLGPGEGASQDHLDGHQPVEVLLPRLVHDAHAAALDFFQQFQRPVAGGRVQDCAWPRFPLAEYRVNLQQHGKVFVPLGKALLELGQGRRLPQLLTDHVLGVNHLEGSVQTHRQLGKRSQHLLRAASRAGSKPAFQLDARLSQPRLDRLR